MRRHLLSFTLNFLGIALLITLIVAPIYFARNFAKVAGAKSESKYLLISQVDKFPNMTFIQEGDNYRISFSKVGPQQAYQQVFIVNNPTDSPQTYSLEVTSGASKVFFGENLDNQLTKISLPQSASVPLGLFSDVGDLEQNQQVQFKIIVKSE